MDLLFNVSPISKSIIRIRIRIRMLDNRDDVLDADLIGKTLCNDTDRFPRAAWGEHPRSDEGSVT